MSVIAPAQYFSVMSSAVGGPYVIVLVVVVAVVVLVVVDVVMVALYGP